MIQSSGSVASESFDTGAGDDSIYSGGGDDTLIGGTGTDTLNGGAGFDTASYANASSAVQLKLWQALGQIGDAAGDRYTSIEKIIGSAFNDSLAGSALAETFEAGNGDDLLFVGGGADAITGGDGNDTISGGGGDDKFAFNFGDDHDRITDFIAGAGTDDVIELIGFGVDFDTFQEVFDAATQQGDDLLIDLGDGDALTLLDTDKGDLHEDDFLFG